MLVHFNGLIILQNYAHSILDLESEEKKNRLEVFWTGFDKISKVKVVKKDFFLFSFVKNLFLSAL